MAWVWMGSNANRTRSRRLRSNTTATIAPSTAICTRSDREDAQHVAEHDVVEVGFGWGVTEISTSPTANSVVNTMPIAASSLMRPGHGPHRSVHRQEAEHHRTERERRADDVRPDHAGQRRMGETASPISDQPMSTKEEHQPVSPPTRASVVPGEQQVNGSTR